MTVYRNLGPFRFYCVSKVQSRPYRISEFTTDRAMNFFQEFHTIVIICGFYLILDFTIERVQIVHTEKEVVEEKNHSNEYYLKKALLADYDKTSRPVRNDSTTVTVYMGMSLFHILSTVSISCTMLIIVHGHLYAPSSTLTLGICCSSMETMSKL